MSKTNLGMNSSVLRLRDLARSQSQSDISLAKATIEELEGEIRRREASWESELNRNLLNSKEEIVGLRRTKLQYEHELNKVKTENNRLWDIIQAVSDENKEMSLLIYGNR